MQCTPIPTARRTSCLQEQYDFSERKWALQKHTRKHQGGLQSKTCRSKVEMRFAWLELKAGPIKAPVAFARS